MPSPPSSPSVHRVVLESNALFFGHHVVNDNNNDTTNNDNANALPNRSVVSFSSASSTDDSTDEEEVDNNNNAMSCSRGAKCLQLCSNTGNSVKSKSCVDCGACALCCSCLEAATTTTTTSSDKPPKRLSRAYSINLGEAQTQVIDELFGNDNDANDANSTNNKTNNNIRRSSSALTLAMSEDDGFTSSMEFQSNNLVVKKLNDKDGAVNKEVYTAALPQTSRRTPGAQRWAHLIEHLRLYTCRFLQWITHYAATYPKACIALVTFTSLLMLIIGLCTNFHIQVENSYLWPPQNSLSLKHTEWYYYNSEFNYDTSFFDMVVHADGNNVLSKEGVRKVFEAIAAVQDLEGYKDGCYWAKLFGDDYYVGECKIHSVADFWNESLAIFETTALTEEDAIRQMSAPVYPNGIYVDEARILGHANRTTYLMDDDDDAINNHNHNNPMETSLLQSAQAFLIEFDLPWTNVTEDFELLALERIQQLQQEWDADPTNPYKIEMAAYRSYGDEFFRAIIKDLPLLPSVFTVMSIFCCFVFYKRDRVKSRCLLGVGAVVCILLSIITGYGLLFIFGVSFTPVTTMMPFLMFGIGLDDSFIIYGSYNRTDPKLDTRERIRQTIDDVGLSISLTTFTSTFAFFMGVFSHIPAVSWVCWYAFPTIIIDFIYQITFFISLIVLDERRIQANRRDICFWSVVPTDGESVLAANDSYCDTDNEEMGAKTNSNTSETPTSSDNGREYETESTAQVTVDFAEPEILRKPAPVKKFKKSRSKRAILAYKKEDAHPADRFMYWFATKLLIKKVQVCVVIAFLTVFGGMLYSATHLRQQFNFIDMVPADSYLKHYYGALDDYTNRNGLYIYVFFKDIDQSDESVQDQMEAYVNDLVDSGAIAHQPSYFWLRDFRQFVVTNEATIGNLTFNEQISEFFRDPSWEDLYGEHVVVNKEDGSVTQSRVIAYVDVNMQVAKEGTKMLEAIRTVTARQPINQNTDDWIFFTYADDYHYLEFYTVVVDELIFTTIMGVLTVSIIGLIFIPHWSAFLYVFPFITFLYIDMLGFLNLSGVQINAISYMTLVMSIGLMVDYIMHILLRYFESQGSREQRIVETLSTMGASILVGAISTFLGILLLAFSTSVIIQNIFVSFIGLVTFGVLHGLVFLPVVLAMVGPE